MPPINHKTFSVPKIQNLVQNHKFQRAISDRNRSLLTHSHSQFKKIIPVKNANEKKKIKSLHKLRVDRDVLNDRANRTQEQIKSSAKSIFQSSTTNWFCQCFFQHFFLLVMEIFFIWFCLSQLHWASDRKNSYMRRKKIVFYQVLCCHLKAYFTLKSALNCLALYCGKWKKKWRCED